MSPRSPENLVNVSAIAFLLDTKTNVEIMGEYILVKKLENGVMILLMDTPSHTFLLGQLPLLVSNRN